jgi:hypothetical protein
MPSRNPSACRRSEIVVPAMSKRRARLYTLPIVVMIAFLAVMGLAARQRADLIATLSEQLSRQNHADARSAIRQLAALSNPPLPLLVEAAACDDHDTAESAQIAITRLVDEWQRHADSGERISYVAQQATELATALANERRTMPMTCYPWLESVTRELTYVAAKCPPKQMPLLAMHCDEIMSVISNANFSSPLSVKLAPPADNRAKGTEVAAAGNDSGVDAARSQLEQAFAETPSVPNEFRGTPRDQPPAPPPLAVDEDGRVNPQGNALRHENAGVDRGVRTQDDKRTRESQLSSLPGGEGRPEWLQPSYRIPPSSDDSSSNHESQSESDQTSASNVLGAYSTRELFERWRTTAGDDHRDIEQQLAGRGFKYLAPPIIEQYLSDELAVRLKIVDTVTKQARGDVRPWLFLLAEDDDAEVRLLAVTVMATSDDRTLIEKAWQISIRDRDPRIADLATHLRDRRSGTQLR